MTIIESGRRIEATYIRHLRTLTGGNSLGGRSQDADLYRTADGRLVVALSDECDARDTPVVDTSRTPADYGYNG